MEYGFVKVAAATPAITVADCSQNAQGIIELATELEKKGAELILFPELSLTSRSCGDLFTQPYFISACNKAINHIAENTAGNNAVIVFGAPVEFRNSLYNCAIVMHRGKIIGIVPKRHLDNKSGEKRWFTNAESLPNDSNVTICGQESTFAKNSIFSTGAYSFGIEYHFCRRYRFSCIVML